MEPCVVTTLAKLNVPSSKIVYSPIRDDEIRLVTIHANNEDAICCQNDSLNYCALSYLWDSQ